MNNSDPIAFFPTMNDTIMDELRTTEGMLFRDENAKKLFLDTKELMIESMYAAYKNFKGEMYQSVLDKYAYWETYVEAEEMARMRFKFKDIETRLLSVVVFYAKFLFNQDDVINIRKPKVETFLKGMFTRLSKNHHVRNTQFFEMDPLKQDFVIRDIFRQALSNDCIQVVMKQEIVVVDEKEKEKEIVEEEKNTKTRFSNKIVLEEDEIYPDDSISVLMEKQQLQQTPIKSVITKDDDTVISSSSKVSTTSSKLKCKVPTAIPAPPSKIVHIENNDD